ncbi:MAG: nucleotidyltransferase substrate binding protein, partial [Cyanobium sp.]
PMPDTDLRWRQRFENFQRALLVLQHQGIQGITGSRDATRLAFQTELIADGDTWMAMIKARNQSSHTYNLEQAQQIAAEVIDRYVAAFAALRDRFAALSAETA